MFWRENLCWASFVKAFLTNWVKKVIQSTLCGSKADSLRINQHIISAGCGCCLNLDKIDRIATSSSNRLAYVAHACIPKLSFALLRNAKRAIAASINGNGSSFYYRLKALENDWDGSSPLCACSLRCVDHTTFETNSEHLSCRWNVKLWPGVGNHTDLSYESSIEGSKDWFVITNGNKNSFCDRPIGGSANVRLVPRIQVVVLLCRPWNINFWLRNFWILFNLQLSGSMQL